MRKLVFTALLGLATSVGAAFPAAAHAEPIDLGAAMRSCSSTYLTVDAPDNDGFDSCVDRAVSVALSEGMTDDATINTGTLGTATDGGVNTAILGTATDGGVNTAILGSACGDGSLNTGILGSAGC